MPDRFSKATAAGVRGDDFMVATGHPVAAETAVAMLDRGGSAVDAAIAADAILGVVEPMATGIGGDLLAMIVQPDGETLTYNGTGRAPLAFDPSMVEGLPGRVIPDRHPLSVTTPGAVRGWFDLHARYGRIAIAELLAPAIRMAEEGFAVGPISAREWKFFAPMIGKDPVCSVLYRADKPPEAGETFANPELAAILRRIAADGPSAFYEGRPAEAAAQASRASGGILSEQDFATHRGNFDKPLSTGFRGLTVLECPPNTHGRAVLDSLDILEPLSLEPANPETWVTSVRAMREGMNRARETVADPAGNTVCTAIVDGDGLGLTMMSSVFKRFGSAIGVPGCGFVLQNRGSGFAEPGHINGPAPGKRAYHTVIPAAALRDRKLHAVFGVVGGAMQPQGHVQLLMRTAAWGEPLQAALDAPRWRLEGELLAIEAGMPPEITSALRAAGFADAGSIGNIAGRSDFGGAQFVVRDADGSLSGASDKRKDGIALGR